MNRKELRKRLSEIINASGDLIGVNDIPEIDNNADSVANTTTDKVVFTGHQDYPNNFVGSHFGFTVLEDNEKDDNKIIGEDKLSEKDLDKSLSTKKCEDKDVLNVKIKKIKDLFDKNLSKTELDKLINLLEKIKNK